MKTILATLCAIAFTNCFASNTPDKNEPRKITTISAVSGERPGVWVWDNIANDVICKSNSTGKCVTVVVTPKAAYTGMSCSSLILELYTNTDAIEKVELYKGEVGQNYIGEVSAFSMTSISDGEQLSYTLGQWTGTYSGPISLNICTVQ